MKKKIFLSLLILFLSATAWADIEINETNFPDEKFRNWLYSQFYGTDRVLTNKEIANVTIINVWNKNIQSLKGIEYFFALESLNCSNNHLTKLDVSKNTKLKSLNCSNNQLTELDVSKNTKLKSIDCSNNQIWVSGMAILVNSLSDSYKKNFWVEVAEDVMHDYKSSFLDILSASFIKANFDNSNKNKPAKILNVIGSENEHNLMGITHAKYAREKGWIPYFYDGKQWQEYAGSDPRIKDVIINEENFPDKNFRNWLLKQKYGVDGILSKKEIASISELDVRTKSIQSLKGIEYFIPLIKLNCENNQLTTLDVSKNTALKELNCGFNQLTTLDVSKNTALTELDCEKNQLTVLDVTKNKDLTFFSCHTNQLTELNLSNNPKLMLLICHINQLTALDMSNNNNLLGICCSQNNIKGAAMDKFIKSLPKRSLKTRQEECRLFAICTENEQNVMTAAQVAAAQAKGWMPRVNNGLNKSIWYDYVGCDKKVTGVEINEENFPDKYFRNLLFSQEYGADGVLTEEELACFEAFRMRSKNIQSLKGIEYFTALTELHCEGNQLTTLDLSKNKKLTELYCYNNQIKGAAMDALIASLPFVKEGRMYVINSNGEQNMMTAVQVAAAQSKGWVPQAKNSLNNEIWYDYVGCDQNVTGVEINEENFPDKNFRNWVFSQEYGADGILTDAELTNVTSIYVGKNNIRSLKGIEFFTALTELQCINNQLTTLDVSQNAALRRLNCDKNQLTLIDMSKNSELTELYCRDNQLTSLDVSGCMELTRLECYENKLTSLDVQKNTKLKIFDCSNNKLTSLVLSNNTVLEELVCKQNKLTTLDVSNNPTLQRLACQWNQLVELNLSKNIVLTKLECYKNKIKGKAMDEFVENLPIVKKQDMLIIYNMSEQNMMTRRQVTAAMRKGWIPCSSDGINWTKYAGRDNPD